MYHEIHNTNQFNDATVSSGQRIAVRPLRRRPIQRTGLRPILVSVGVGLLIGIVFVPFSRYFLSAVTTKILTFHERYLDRHTEVFAQLHIGELFKRRGQSDELPYVTAWQKIDREMLHSTFINPDSADDADLRNVAQTPMNFKTLPPLEIAQNKSKTKTHSIELSKGVLPCDTLVTDMRPTGMTQRRRSNVQIVHGRNSLILNGEVYYRFLTPR